MTFGQAIVALKQGRMVRRAGWNGKGMLLYLEGHLTKTQDVNRKYEPCICMFTAQGKHQPGWLASQPDMLSEDWELVP